MTDERREDYTPTPLPSKESPDARPLIGRFDESDTGPERDLRITREVAQIVYKSLYFTKT